MRKRHQLKVKGAEGLGGGTASRRRAKYEIVVSEQGKQAYQKNRWTEGVHYKFKRAHLFI